MTNELDMLIRKEEFSARYSRSQLPTKEKRISACQIVLDRTCSEIADAIAQGESLGYLTELEQYKMDLENEMESYKK